VSASSIQVDGAGGVGVWAVKISGEKRALRDLAGKS
jgi:hypothetical protein